MLRLAHSCRRLAVALRPRLLPVFGAGRTRQIAAEIYVSTP